MRDLWPWIGMREEPLCALIRLEHHVDGDISIGVAVGLDAGAMHSLDPGVEVVLRGGDIAPIRRLDALIWLAERHRPLRELAIASVFRCGAELDPLVPETGPNARLDNLL